MKQFLEWYNPKKCKKELKTKTIYSKYLSKKKEEENKKESIRLVIRLGLLNIFKNEFIKYLLKSIIKNFKNKI